jgi:hypothetical protein
MNLSDYLARAKTSLFRFEFLQEFNVPQESDALKMWQDSKKVDKEYFQRWWNFVKEKTGKGVVMQRVRLVKLPLTDYTRWELAVHDMTAKFGDDIRVIKEADYKKLGLDLKDFWVVDDTVVLDMEYNKAGEYIDSAVMPQIDKYLQAKKLLLAKSVPLKKFKYK